MNIIAKSATVTSAQALYNLTQAPDRKKLTEAKEAMELTGCRCRCTVSFRRGSF